MLAFPNWNQFAHIERIQLFFWRHQTKVENIIWLICNIISMSSFKNLQLLPPKLINMVMIIAIYPIREFVPFHSC